MLQLEVVHVVDAALARPARSRTTPRPTSPITSSSASSSVALGEPARHRLAVDAAVRSSRSWWRNRRRRRPSPRAGRACISRDLVVGGGALVGVVAHHEEAQRGVTDVRGEVHRRCRAARPTRGTRGRSRSPTGCRRRASATSMSSTFSSVRAISSRCSGTRRRDREAAVAGDDGGDAVEARRRERRVPEDLRVVVRVDVDEARARRRARRRRAPGRRRGRARSR